MLIIADMMLIIFTIICGLGATMSSAPFRSITFFITFGLAIALCWVRLDAPDVALAEAAIGAGLSGIVFLKAYKILSNSTDQERDDDQTIS
ncbi:DUF4040 domain-containing protein [Salinimonas sp. HHU 13199]|uniref:DUF4040 domain-containing protein n=1 Tax=Salinimonas profundi TaxID=2729140 RepID=A0ABR8LIB4_9ALTE|nr:hydrogenase subunit MbhD domain-containing protein [Salinimonas profundi]MBD3584938.1 DUF4040 domain-containing protein [Salinimonas profundi]